MMRPTDWPEYLLSVGLLCYSAYMASFPVLLVAGAFVIAVGLAMYLPPAVPRFRFMWRLTFFVWVLVVWYAHLTARLTGASPLLVPTSYVGALLGFYLWHHLAHQRWTGRMYQVHMRHHLKVYPPKNYMSDTHHPSHSFFSGDGFWHEGPLYVLVLLQLLGIRVLFFCDDASAGELFSQMGMCAFGLALFGYLGNQLHYAMHIRGHWLERFEGFLLMRELHWIHHKGDMKKNLMLLNFSMDELFGSKNYNREIDEALAGTKEPRERLRRQARAALQQTAN